MNRSRKYEELRENGFCVFPDVLDAGMLGRLRAVTDRLLSKQRESARKKYRYQGSNIEVGFQDPVFAELISLPRALACLHQLGFANPKYWSGYLISKPANSPPLYWHQDWPYWDEAISASPDPAQLFLMYYLTDTTPHNGCLRVIPRSHRMRVPLHDQLPPAHGPETLNADPASPIFALQPDEIDVKVKAGELVIGDARVLHAAHANRSDQSRTVLTLWYVPNFDALPEGLKANFGRKSASAAPAGIPERDLRLVDPLIPRYDGDAKPTDWNRVPGKYLRPGSL